MDFIRSEGELKNCALYGFYEVLRACSEPVRRCEKGSGQLKSQGGKRDVILIKVLNYYVMLYSIILSVILPLYYII